MNARMSEFTVSFLHVFVVLRVKVWNIHGRRPKSITCLSVSSVIAASCTKTVVKIGIKFSVQVSGEMGMLLLLSNLYFVVRHTVT